MDRFEYDAEGNLNHYINDELRAIVPAAHVADYQTEWPDAPDFVPPVPPTGN